MNKCHHSFNTVGTNNSSYVWWCKKCGCVERGGNHPTLIPKPDEGVFSLKGKAIIIWIKEYLLWRP